MFNSRKYLLYLGIILILSGLSFIVGILIAQKKINRINLSAISKVTIDLSEKEEKNLVIPENSSEIGNESEEIKLDQGGNGDEEKEADQESEIPPKDKLTFGIIGDTQYFKAENQEGGLQKTVRFLASKNMDLIMATGDLVSGCDKDNCESKLTNWKNTLGDLYPKTYTVMGNHDRTDREKSDAIWQKFFTLPTNGPAGYSELTYSFDFKNSHFVVLNSEKPDENVINDVQRSWLERDLNMNKKENVFVFFHEPAYPVGSKIGESLDVNPQKRNALWNVLSAHKVTAVFNGHEHIASRKKINGIYQFTFGNTDSFNHEAPKPGMTEWSYVGESFAIVEVTEKNTKVDSYSSDGKLLNSFSF